MKEWSLGFIFDREFQFVILLKKSRTMHVGLWNGVGGKVESGETPLQSMIRECMEETKMDITDWTLVGFLEGKNDTPIGVHEFWRVNIFGAIASKPEVTEVTAGWQTKAETDTPYRFAPSEVAYLPLAPHTEILMHTAKAKLQKPNLPVLTLRES